MKIEWHTVNNYNGLTAGRAGDILAVIVRYGIQKDRHFAYGVTLYAGPEQRYIASSDYVGVDAPVSVAQEKAQDMTDMYYRVGRYA